MNTDPQTCPNCHHDQHLPGTDCDAVMGHGPNRWHRCLCLARPGAALSCPPQMTCQGGTLGYADIWYLQHGHTLVTADGEISPEAVMQTGVMSVGFPSGAPEPAPAAPVAAPPTRQAGLRDRIAAALYEHTHPGSHWSDTSMPADWRPTYLEEADAVLSVLPAPVDRAAVLREAADGFDRHAEKILDGFENKAVFVAKALRDQAAVWREAAETLRRLAAETPGPETQGGQWYRAAGFGQHDDYRTTAPAVVAEPGKEN